MPSRTLVRRFKYTDLLIGATIIAAKFEKLGHEVVFYDLNNMFNTYELEIDPDLVGNIDELLQKKDLPEFKNSETYRSCQKMYDFIQKERFDLVAFSLEKAPHKVNILTMNFALTFADFFNQPVYIGGKNLLRHYGIEKVKSLLDQNINVKGFYYGSSAKTFLDHVNAHGESTERFYWNEEESPFGSAGDSDLTVSPKVDPVNYRDIQAKIIPEEVVQSFPELRDAAPVMIVPYRFIIGCPKKCAFCETGLDKFFRTKNIPDIVDYFKSASDKGINTFRFMNSNLNFTKKFILELCNAIVKENIKITFSDSAVLENITPEVCSALVSAGCVKLWYGAESLSDNILADIQKGITSEEIYRSLEIADAAGIWNSVNLIFNFPNETEEDFSKMIQFVQHGRHLFQTVQINEFQLMTKSGYYVNRERYGIQVDKNYFNGQEVTFSDRLNSASEIRARGLDRYKRIASIIDSVDLGVCSNDMLLFSVHSVIKNKKDKLKVFERLVSFYKENPERIEDLLLVASLNFAESREYENQHAVAGL